eukprot:15437195-Alexandrium_andersonii.AAC.1
MKSVVSSPMAKLLRNSFALRGDRHPQVREDLRAHLRTWRMRDGLRNNSSQHRNGGGHHRSATMKV